MKQNYTFPSENLRDSQYKKLPGRIIPGSGTAGTRPHKTNFTDSRNAIPQTDIPPKKRLDFNTENAAVNAATQSSSDIRKKHKLLNIRR